MFDGLIRDNTVFYFLESSLVKLHKCFNLPCMIHNSYLNGGNSSSRVINPSSAPQEDFVVSELETANAMFIIFSKSLQIGHRSFLQ